MGCALMFPVKTIPTANMKTKTKEEQIIDDVIDLVENKTLYLGIATKPTKRDYIREAIRMAVKEILGILERE